MTVPMCALTDTRLQAWMAALIRDRGLTTVVETGIDRGGSTYLFSQMAAQVIGIDNDPAKIAITAALLQGDLQGEGVTNVQLVQENSPTALRRLTANGVDASKTLFFLDAHWQTYWPLKDEIRAIPRGQGVLVMHDVRVPTCPTLHADVHGGQELNYAYVQDVLTEWSPTHRVEYNDDTANGPRRGVMVVYPA